MGANTVEFRSSSPGLIKVFGPFMVKFHAGSVFVPKEQADVMVKDSSYKQSFWKVGDTPPPVKYRAGSPEYEQQKMLAEAKTQAETPLLKKIAALEKENAELKERLSKKRDA